MNPDDIETTKADKNFFPQAELTKGDVVAHYRSVADAMLPLLRGRPLTLRRYPDGIDGENWFQKEASGYFPDWIRVETVPQQGYSGTVRHVICEDAATLIYLANQAAIEFHVWPSTVESLDKPDLLVIDLDPPDGAGVSEVRTAARQVRDLYRELGLSAFVQSTGGRGFHVIAPLDAKHPYDDVRSCVRDAADLLARRHPDRLTTAQRKDKRGDRIFLDTNRNGYGQTFVAPYSLRARPSAGVATPLTWDELGRTTPDGWRPAGVRRRLARKADPWAGLWDAAGSAATAARRLRELSGP